MEWSRWFSPRNRAARRDEANPEPAASVQHAPAAVAEPGKSLERPDSSAAARLVYEALALGVEYAYGCAVSGDIAEFGTMSGSTAVVLARAMREFSDRYRVEGEMHGIGPRKLMLFDSFQGFPQTSNDIDGASPHVASKVWGPGVARGLTASELHALCAGVLGDDQVQVVPGWYRDSLPGLSSDHRFALVSIDCDLYESTADVLEFLLGRKTYSDGCAIFFDDWYCNRGSPNFGEQRAWAEYTRKYDVQFTDWGPYGCVGRKFILHRTDDK